MRAQIGCLLYQQRGARDSPKESEAKTMEETISMTNENGCERMMEIREEMLKLLREAAKLVKHSSVLAEPHKEIASATWLRDLRNLLGDPKPYISCVMQDTIYNMESSEDQE